MLQVQIELGFGEGVPELVFSVSDHNAAPFLMVCGAHETQPTFLSQRNWKNEKISDES